MQRRFVGSRTLQLRQSPASQFHIGSRSLSVVVSTEESGTVETGRDSGEHSQFYQRITAGKHTLHADEPLSLGGADEGASPYEMLLGSLGACTSITLQMYAKRKQLPLLGVEVELDHSKVYKSDCENCELEGDLGSS